MRLRMTPEHIDIRQDTITSTENLWRLVALGTVAINLAMLLFALAVAQVENVDARIFYQDPSSVAHLGFYTGWISFLGASLWIGSGAAALFAGLTTRRWDCTFLGILTLSLGMDDLLLVHEGVLRWFLIPEIVPMVGYAIAGLFWFFRLRLRTFDGAIIFVSAGFMLVISAFIDELGWLAPLSPSTVTVAEEVVKEVGIFLWAAGAVGYATMTARLGRQDESGS